MTRLESLLLGVVALAVSGCGLSVYEVRDCVPSDGGLRCRSLGPGAAGAVGCAPGSAGCAAQSTSAVDGGDPEGGCQPGATESCISPCGTVGERSCGAGQAWGGCHPPAEQCNNSLDDDCDGKTDGQDSDCWACQPGSTQSCVTSCASTGVKRCNASGAWGSCQPPAEACHNGRDDDCDDAVDGSDFDCPPVRYVCEDYEGGNCNGDPGYGDNCAASDNTNGCSPSKFWAWCNRRNPQYPNIWDDWVHNWVDSRCDRAVTMVNNTFTCLSSANVQYECTTPLVLVFEPESPVELSSAEHRFRLRPGVDGRSDWPARGTPWLALDRNRNGAIDDGSELFGSSTRLSSGRTAANGFEALSELDANRDGVVSAIDPDFPKLLVWSDANRDGVSQPQELKAAPAAGLISIAVRYSVSPRCDARGNCERERASFTFLEPGGRVRLGAVVDVHLRLEPERRARAVAGEALACRPR
ncbi:MAG: hypothetical protein HYZ28_08755 [Myxococcales bacterium]|nr:hypothetical protein [Myxococcales bacterium]